MYQAHPAPKILAAQRKCIPKKKKNGLAGHGREEEKVFLGLQGENGSSCRGNWTFCSCQEAGRGLKHDPQLEEEV